MINPSHGKRSETFASGPALERFKMVLVMIREPAS
jgi:hypothetical protein